MRSAVLPTAPLLSTAHPAPDAARGPSCPLSTGLSAAVCQVPLRPCVWGLPQLGTLSPVLWLGGCVPQAWPHALTQSVCLAFRRAHTLTVLFILTCVLGYVTLLEETPQDTAYNTKR